VDSVYVDSVLRELAARGYSMTDGLTDAEFDLLERTFGITFPLDLRRFLATVLPVDRIHHVPRFPDWRGDVAGLGERLAWPVESICFDVEHDAFWYPAWGEQPHTLEDRIVATRRFFDQAPRLVPVFSHRYMACEPMEAGNPVWSMYQTDIILYGRSLPDYFAQEFGVPAPWAVPATPVRIRVWTDFIDYVNESE
jgi:hypothetical protein